MCHLKQNAHLYVDRNALTERAVLRMKTKNKLENETIDLIGAIEWTHLSRIFILYVPSGILYFMPHHFATRMIWCRAHLDGVQLKVLVLLREKYCVCMRFFFYIPPSGWDIFKFCKLL